MKSHFQFKDQWWLALLCLWLGANGSHAATFTVTNTLDSGAGSLRQAILDGNSNSESNSIIFQIGGTAPFTITPLTALPAVGNPTLIDGTTQNGFTNTPVIELNGAAATGANVGLQLLSGFNTVRGLAINRFSAEGIMLTGPSNVIQGNHIGTDVTGKIARGNTSFGVWVKSSGNLIGGTNAGSGNVISGNNTGIFFSGLTASTNTVQGNLIGVAAGGTNALGNTVDGIMIYNSRENGIGGTNALRRNVVSGNRRSGIALSGSTATGNQVQGNYIGLNISGSLMISNATNGINLNAPGNVISGNVISGNGFSGVFINQTVATNNIVSGNLIGTDATGKTAIANNGPGVEMSAASGNLLGGTNAGAGNVISGNTQNGVVLTDGAARNWIQGNLIGLSAAGTNAIPNGFNGISLSSAGSNIIGGVTSSARNVISGNASNGVGILLLGDRGNSILGNYIGTDVSGTKAIANTLAGVRIQGCTNVVGGVATGSGNVISGNGQQGVWLVGTSGNVTGNLIQGNLIGLDATGLGGLPNGNAGVGVSSAAGNQIGGTATGARNVISANGDAGIFFIGTGTATNQVLGNFIGTDAAGTLARGNTREGIYLERAATNQIGSRVAGAGNLISANHTRGIFLTNASWNVIQGNFIGIKADGASALGNTFHNIEMQSSATNNLIGETAPGAGNRIAFSGQAGVRVRDGALNDKISGNSIFSNTALGIDLGTANPNSILSCESGVLAGAANAGQNFPTLTSAYSGIGTKISGTLDSIKNKTYELQFFASPAGDATGYGEGQVFLGQTNLTLGTTLCTSNFTVLLPVTVPANWVITATATNPTNNTSEFSAWIPVVPVPAVQIAFASPPGRISLSWTNNGGSYGLEQTLSLSPPPLWTTVAGAPVLSNGFYVVTAPTTNGTTFYRLKVP